MQTISFARSRLTSRLGWTRHSYYLLSAFVATLFVIGVVWWPLVEEQLAWIDWSRPLWLQMDWLLLGIVDSTTKCNFEGRKERRAAVG